MWFVYIVQCSDKSFYTGITNNLERRINEHNVSNSVSSRYVRSRRPVKLVFSETAGSRIEALKREEEIKKLSRKMKEKIVWAASSIGRAVPS